MPFVASYENSRSRTEGAGSVTWIATFADGGREYIAIGRDRNQMAVFRVDCALQDRHRVLFGVQERRQE